MIFTLILTAFSLLTGIYLLAAMCWKNETFLGAVAIMVLSVGGLATTVLAGLTA